MVTIQRNSHPKCQKPFVCFFKQILQKAILAGVKDERLLEAQSKGFEVQKGEVYCMLIVTRVGRPINEMYAKISMSAYGLFVDNVIEMDGDTYHRLPSILNLKQR